MFMKVIFTRDLRPGMELEQDIMAPGGVVRLLAQGACLKAEQIERLKNWGLAAVPSVHKKKIREKEKPLRLGLYMTKEEFQQGYTETLDTIVQAFSQKTTWEEAALAKMQELIDQKIILLVETAGSLDFLHGMRSHDQGTFRHSLNVAILCGILGRWCHYRGQLLKDFILTGLLHDIGKIYVPLKILNKPGRLEAKEFAVIQKHPGKAYELLKKSKIPENVKQGILQHHECIDGSGYPYGKKGQEICREARIVSVADVFEAVTSKRPYHSPMPRPAALDLLKDYMFTKLAPEFCWPFIQQMQQSLIGSQVILSNGQAASIVAFAKNSAKMASACICMVDGRLLDLSAEKLYIVKEKTMV